MSTLSADIALAEAQDSSLARLAALEQHADLGLTVEETARQMCVRPQDIYGAARVLGIKFRHASLGNRNRHRAPPSPVFCGDEP